VTGNETGHALATRSSAIPNAIPSGYPPVMSTKKVTITMNPDTEERARAAAEQAGMSLSAWLDRAARQQALRDHGEQHDRWLAENPDVRDEIAAFEAFADRVGSGNWAELGEAA
jgi:post-segregation antitoxin (ccd killing protein)